MAFRLIAHGATDVGLKRQKNEDYFAILEDEELLVLADGMGGHASGQVASRLATEHVVEFWTETCRQPGFQWKFPVPEGASFEEAAIANSIQYANERTFIESMKDSRLEGMGTTLCVMLGAGRQLVLAHVGDSRIYRYRDGALTQVTRDHSLLNHYLDTGTITQAEAKDFKNKNVIIRAIGLKDHVDPEVQVTDKRDGDIYLMCSDGLSDLVDDWIIKNTIEDSIDDLDAIAQKLIRLANQSGGKDNITIVIGSVIELPGEEELTNPSGYPQMENDPYREDDTLAYGEGGAAVAPQAPPPSPTPSPVVQPDRQTIPPPPARRAGQQVVASPGKGAQTIGDDAPTPRDGYPAQPAKFDPTRR